MRERERTCLTLSQLGHTKHGLVITSAALLRKSAAFSPAIDLPNIVTTFGTKVVTLQSQMTASSSLY